MVGFNIVKTSLRIFLTKIVFKVNNIYLDKGFY